MSVIALSMLTILALLAACGGGGTQGGTQGEQGTQGGQATTAAEGEGEAAATVGPGAEEGAVAPSEETATAAAPDLSQIQPTPEPTPLPDVACTAEQKQIVWMVRNDPVMNPWEVDIVRPDFQKAHPEICLKIVSIRQDDIAVKREAMIAAGDPLHVWSPNWGGDGFASDRARGLLADLTPLIQRDNFDLSVFNPDVIKIYQKEGKTWGLPFLTTGSYVFYNKKLFDEAKVPYPPVDWDDTSWTWEAFVETAKKLTKNIEDINQAQFGVVADRLNLEGPPMLFGQFVFPENAYETGFADKVTVSDEKSVRAYQAFHDLRYKDKVSPDSAAAAALDQLGGAFAGGRSAMQITGGWGFWSYSGLMDDPQGFCWGAAPLPMGSPDAKIRAVIYTDPWAITRGLQPDEQDAAWEFVKFLVSEEQARKFMEVSGTPPTQTKLMADWYKQFEKCMKPEDTQKVFEGAFSHGRESSNHLLVRWDELNQIWTNTINPAFDDPQADIQATLQQVEQQTNEALERIKAEGAQ